MEDLVAFLQSLPLLANVSREALVGVATRSRQLQVPAGGWLFHEGDPADAVYVVRSGRLEVLRSAGGQQSVISAVGRGAAVGDLALLTGSRRSRGVRAVRDTELISLDRTSFEALLRNLPELAIHLARTLAHQLQADDRPGFASIDQPCVVGLLVSEAARDAILRPFVQALGRFGRADFLVDEPGGRANAPGVELDRLEQTNDIIVLVVTSTDTDAWRRFCLRQADVLAVVLAPGDTPLSLPPGDTARPAHVMYLSAGVGAAERLRLLGSLRPRSQHLAPSAALQPAVDRLARRVMGQSVGVVLSAGGARGFAHIGVIEVLQHAGLEIDRIGGCSMGAFVGALLAEGLTPAEMIEVCRREVVEGRPFNDYTIPRVALLRARKAERMLERVFGDLLLEELPTDFFSVSCDLVSARVVIHRSGATMEAVGASMSLPGLVPPLRHLDGLLVDGGLLNALPVDVMAEEPGSIVAVDVIGDGWEPRTRAYEPRPIPSGWQATLRHLAGRGSDRLPKLTETLARLSVVGSRRMTEENRQLADVMITPDVGRTGVLEFHKLDQMVEIGRAAGRGAAEAALALTAVARPSRHAAPR